MSRTWSFKCNGCGAELKDTDTSSPKGWAEVDYREQYCPECWKAAKKAIEIRRAAIREAK